ncbi:MAG: hypothetical protein PHU44_06150 [Syntrophales bacterium]|nr:hypothetical protein [Syntrophales bacterium]MDD5643199.1 hypothetical protein [Syntrophales bacterium]
MPLKQWIEQVGTEGRRRLYKAIKAKFPGFTQVSLTNYIQGQRVPEFEVAQIISEETGIPIFLLPFRFIHRPPVIRKD